jgi:hypothetical protein
MRGIRSQAGALRFGGEMKPQVHIRLEYKTAKKLLEALEKGVYDKLTRAQADAISEFCFDFRCQVMEASDSHNGD